MRKANNRLLIVDNRDSRNLVIYLLQQAGYQVTKVNSIADAISLARIESFSLMLFNHKMLNKESVQPCGKLLRLTPRVPMLFYSSVAYPYRERETISLRVGGSRIKIISGSEVVEEVSRLLSQPPETVVVADHGFKPAARVKSLSRAAKVCAGLGIGAAVILFTKALSKNKFSDLLNLTWWVKDIKVGVMDPSMLSYERKQGQSSTSVRVPGVPSPSL